MKRLPRLLPSLTLAACLAMPVVPVWAQESPAAPATPPPAAPAAPAAPADQGTPPAAPAPATPAPDQAAPAAPGAADQSQTPAANPLQNDVDDYWHWGVVGRYDLAAASGEKVLQEGSDPRAVLEAFEATAKERQDNLDQWLLRWRTLDPTATNDKTEQANIQKMKDVTVKLIDKVNAGYATRRSDPTFIENTIKAMSANERAYENGMARLNNSGELAVPIIIDFLRNPSQRQYHSVCRRALRDLKRKALNPLLAATEMKEAGTLAEVVAALGDIGYDTAIPYLARIAQAPDTNAGVKQAAVQSLAQLNAGNVSSIKPADGFYQLSERFYYGNAPIQPEDKVGYIWFWDQQKGLGKVDVPAAIFNDRMSMRESEYALKSNPDKGEAVSLWLAANNKREADLNGATDPISMPADAHFYNVSAGVRYVDTALSRALNDGNAEVALKLVRSLESIIGSASLAGQEGGPLTQALTFPNRLVRYEAAFALASTLPTRGFPASERVIPLLVEAISQTSKPNVLVIAGSQQAFNTLQKTVSDMGYTVAGTAQPSDAVGAAQKLPAVDVIVIDARNTSEVDIANVMSAAVRTPKLQGASEVLITKTDASQYAVGAKLNPLMNTTTADDKEGLQKAIEGARKRAGSVALNDKAASGYAVRAASLLEMLALSHSQVLDPRGAQDALVGDLNDTRPEVVQAVAGVLAFLPGKQTQTALLNKANDPKVPDDVRVSLFKGLASNAQISGNTLDQSQVQELDKAIADAKAPAVKSAAAEARGALNLPSNQAQTLIVQQSKV